MVHAVLAHRAEQRLSEPAMSPAAHYEQVALRRWEYEKEIAEGREIYAALAMFRRVKPGQPSDDEASAA